MHKFLFLFFVALPCFASVEITSGHIYIEIEGVQQEGYHNQVYKAQEAAINASMECECTVRIIMPDQTVTYTDTAPTPEPADWIVIDNPSATFVGTWAPSGVAGYIGDDATYTPEQSASATFTIAATPGVYEVEANITSSPVRTTRAVYSAGEQSVTIDQTTNSGWTPLFSVELPGDLTVMKNEAGNSLVVDAIRYRYVGPATTPEPTPEPEPAGSSVRIFWEQPTLRVDGSDLKTVNRYDVHVLNGDGVTSVYSMSSTEMTLELEPGDYRVVVRAVDSANTAGEWSDPLEFTL